MKRRSLLIAAGTSVLSACGGSSGQDNIIPMPPTLRTDLHNVYYLGLAGQLDQTGDHTSLFWHAQWFDLARLAADLAKHHRHDLVLDCGAQLFSWQSASKKYRFLPDAQSRLASLFGQMRALGILQRVKYIVPGDEPNLNCESEADVHLAVDAIEAEIVRWPELAGVKLTCIYADWDTGWWALNRFAVVGVDNYSQGSGVLVGDGAHARLVRALQPGQRTMIIPGAAFGQDPAPFVAYAHSNPQVEMVVPFLWSHVQQDVESWVGLERQSPENQERYRRAGLTVLNRP